MPGPGCAEGPPRSPLPSRPLPAPQRGSLGRSGLLPAGEFCGGPGEPCESRPDFGKAGGDTRRAPGPCRWWGSCLGKFIPYGKRLGCCLGSVVVEVSSKRILKLHQERWRVSRERCGAPGLSWRQGGSAELADGRDSQGRALVPGLLQVRGNGLKWCQGGFRLGISNNRFPTRALE